MISRSTVFSQPDQFIISPNIDGHSGQENQYSCNEPGVGQPCNTVLMLNCTDKISVETAIYNIEKYGRYDNEKGYPFALGCRPEWINKGAVDIMCCKQGSNDPESCIFFSRSG